VTGAGSREPGAGASVRGSLRAPGGILLVSCYELGHQPLGTAWPAAFLERAGFAPAQLDLALEPLDAARVGRARLVVVATPMHTALRIGAAAIARIRALHPACIVVAHGLYAALNAAWLRQHGADVVLGGEIEGELVALAERLDRGDGTTAEPVPALVRLTFPVPSRAALPAPGRYAALERDGRLVPAAAVETSRGCLHQCRHCPIPPVYGGRFFVIPPEVVLADVRQLVAAGVGHITFADPDFLNGPGHALRVARALHAEFPAVTFDCTAKIEHLLRHRALLPELAASGCVFIVSAVESLSDRVLAILDKGHDRTDVRTALGLTRAAGIALRPSFVPFTPWTTLDDHLELFRFVAAEGLIDEVDPVQYTLRLLIPPGSLLLGRPELAPHLGPLDAAAFTYRWTHPDPRMDQLQAESVALVRRAAADARPPEETFERLWVLASGSAKGRGREPGAGSGFRRGTNRSPLPAPRSRSPRLTEPWFC
jgi:radical SAM superfamily enzyme YgiQ (UPF0313 family)